MLNEDQSGATEGCPHCGGQEVHYSKQSVSWWCNSCEKSFTKYCLCADCLYGKKEYCSEIWSPSATKCRDFVHRESKDFQPRGTKPGLEGRNYMATTTDLATRGEIEPYHETRSGERDKDCPTCGGNKTAKFYRGQYYLDEDMVFRCAGCHGIVSESEIGESLKLLSASPRPSNPTKTEVLKRGETGPHHETRSELDEHSSRTKVCPHCGSSKTYYNSHFRSWKCASCEKSFGFEGKESLWDRTIGRLLSWIR